MLVRLRDARRALGDDLDYLNASLPQLVEFPDSKVLLQAHQDLSQFELLKEGVETGDVPALADSTQDTLAAAQRLLSHIEDLRSLREKVLQANRTWPTTIRQRLRSNAGDELLVMLVTLGTELEHTVQARKAFIERPVNAPRGLELDVELSEAVEKLSVGRSPFGFGGFFGKAEQKKRLESIRVLNSAPATAQDWQHVASYLALLKRLRELAVRWNALATELGISSQQGITPEHALNAAQDFALYRTITAIVAAEAALCKACAAVFPSWPHAREVDDNSERLAELERALRHHLTKSRLANVWGVKERFQSVLEGRSGRVVDDVRQFLARTLGNPRVSDAEMQASWSALMAELLRIFGVGSQLAAVRDICDQIESSGAPRYADALRKPLTSQIDDLLPDNWRKAWRSNASAHISRRSMPMRQ